MKYLIVDWNTGRIISDTEDLKDAKKTCRALGYEVQYRDLACTQKVFAPIAFVGHYDTELERVVCDYNPRFSKKDEK